MLIAKLVLESRIGKVQKFMTNEILSQSVCCVRQLSIFGAEIAFKHNCVEELNGF